MSSLQMLSAICSSIKSFLGPDLRIKCIHGEEDSSLVSSCSELLRSLDVEHPIGRIAVEASLAHQKSHGTGTTTMMAMAGQWATEIQSLKNQGIPTPAIIKYGDECLEQCLLSLESIAVPCTKITSNSDFGRTETFSDTEIQANTSYKQSNCEDNSSTRTQPRIQEPLITNGKFEDGCRVGLSENNPGRLGATTEVLSCKMQSLTVLSDEVEQFVEVQFSSQRHDQSITRPTKSESRANLPKINNLRHSASGMQDDDNEDDVSWFFEETSQSKEYSLECLKSDCGAIFNGEEGGKGANHRKELTESLTGNASRGTCEGSDDEFDSCFPLEDQDTTSKPTDIVSGKHAPDDSDEFDSCFPMEENDSIPKTLGNYTGSPTLDSSADDFDSCFPVEISTVSQNIRKEESTNGIKSEENYPDNQQTNELDVNSAKTFLEGGQTAEKLEHSKIANFDWSRCNTDLTTQNHLTRTKSQTYRKSKTAATIYQSQQKHGSGIQETMKDLLRKRSKQMTAERLVSVQNSSRHFRTMETAAVQTTAEKVEMTSGQRLNPEVTLSTSDVSEEGQIISSGYDFQAARLCGKHSDFSMDTNDQQIPDIEHLGLGLRHGADLEMRLVIEAFQMQMEDNPGDGIRIPDLNRLNVCTIAGPPVSESHLQPGLLLSVDHYQRHVIIESKGKHLKTLLVNGDASPTFKHAGYKNKIKRTTVHTWTGIPSTEEKSWLRKTASLLQELDVNLLILKGRGDEHLIHHCLSKKILLFQDVPYKSLLALGDACSAPILTYLTDATMDDTACGTTVACWESGWVKRTRVKGEVLKTLFARVCVDGKVLQTVVLCHPVPSLLSASQDRFWISAHRLQGVVADGCFLPGAGLPEQTAIKQLLRLNEWSPTVINHDNQFCFKSSIVSAFAEGFVHYLIQVLKNMGKLDHKSLAKTLIMDGLQNDKLERVLSSSFQPEPVIPTDLPDCALNPTGLKWPEPDKSSESQFEALANKSRDNLACNSRILQAENTQAKYLSETESFITTTKTNPATPHEHHGVSSKQKRSVDCDNGIVYDNYSAKRAAWENAWALLKTVLRIDAHITTGVEKQGQSGSFSSCGQLVIL